jgi:hypothetical protein
MRENLDRIDREDPSWSGRLYWRAVVERYSPARPGQLAPAALLRQYVQREPRDPQGWYALVSAELQQSLPSGHLGVEPDPPPALEKMEDDVLSLVRSSGDPRHLNLIGWYYALRHRPKTGLNFALRALAMEPGFADCWDTLALLYYRSGRLGDALAAQRRAAALATLASEAGGGVPPTIQARLDFYEKAAAREPANPVDAPRGAITPAGPAAAARRARLDAGGGRAPAR